MEFIHRRLAFNPKIYKKMLQALSLVLPICVQTSICHQSTHLCRQIKYSTVMQWGFCAGTGSSPDQIINYRRLWRVPPSVSEWPGGVPLTADLIAFFGLWVSGRSPLSQHPLSGFLRVFFPLFVYVHQVGFVFTKIYMHRGYSN